MDNWFLNRLTCSNCQSIFTKDSSYFLPKVRGICDFCGNKLITRKDDTEEIIRLRFNIFNEKTAPLLEFYESQWVETIELDAKSPVVDVATAIMELVKQ